MKDKNTIINHLVTHAADIMEAKADYLDDVASMFGAKGDTALAYRLQNQAWKTREAVEVMREHEGCWV